MNHTKKTVTVSESRFEAGHYQDCLTLAEQIAAKDISAGIRFIADKETELISAPDSDSKFHSGVPA